MPKTTPDKSYQELSDELALLLAELQQEAVDIDQAMTKYERGLEIIRLLEAQLKTAENKVTKLKAQFDKGVN